MQTVIDRIMNDIDGLDQGDPEMRLLYQRLFKLAKEKQVTYHELALSKETGLPRYIVTFHHDNGVSVLDISDGHEFLMDNAA